VAFGHEPLEIKPEKPDPKRQNADSDRNQEVRHGLPAAERVAPGAQRLWISPHPIREDACRRGRARRVCGKPETSKILPFADPVEGYLPCFGRGVR
jgi:hypothetical protein